MATHTLQMHAMYSPMSSDHPHGAPLGGDTSDRLPPSMPSPTLTNPDMLLPHTSIMSSVPSPPQHSWRDRLPSPSYLREQASGSPQPPRSNGSSSRAETGARVMAAKKERRGLMSRKMMLLRSRTASNNGVLAIPRSMPPEADSDGYGSNYASSPTLMDVGNLAPEQLDTEYKRASIASSLGSDELAGMPQFLAKYEQKDEATTDDGSEEGSVAATNYGYSVTIEGGMDERRRQQEEDEHNSAILSKRAEAILANAKKRLNLMEGNLRGARDLVAPLTTANLKRATSVGSSHVTPASTYGTRSRIANGVVQRNSVLQTPTRTLHAQASSPVIGSDYRQGHWRGFSETEIPERPHTALERTNSPVRSGGRIPLHPEDLSWTANLRGSKSYDSLGRGAMRQSASRERLYLKCSPDPNLEPLAEDDDTAHRSVSQNGRSDSGSRDAMEMVRSPSRTDDLREQMHSLKGKISTLKERAREDSLRRQSLQNLREPSPLNNATVNAPEYFYTSSQSYGSPVLDTNAGVGRTSQNNSPQTPSGLPKGLWDTTQPASGSRNAFAEQASKPMPLPRSSDGNATHVSQKSSRKSTIDHRSEEPNGGRVSSSGPVTDLPNHRRKHSHATARGNMPGAFEVDDDDEFSSPVIAGDARFDSRRRSSEPFSEAGASVYEDAEVEPKTLVAHEDRADAFDYEHFFLHSAMGIYSKDRRRDSGSSEDSVATARGPTMTAGYNAEPDEIYDDEEAFSSSPSEMPEKTRDAQFPSHRRTLSDESVSTLATFATATEGRDSPPALRSVEPNAWPLPTQQWPANPTSRLPSRPNTAVPDQGPERSHRHHRRTSSSERADSGVGLTTTSSSSSASTSTAKTSPPPLTVKSTSLPSGPAINRLTRPLSPPMSPSPSLALPHDPATLAVNAVLGSTVSGGQLGLKDKALLFGLVESLRRVSQRLQQANAAGTAPTEDGDGGAYERRVLRRRLEDARKVLDGIGI